MKQISVVGSGTMGNGIAHVFAQSGYSVSLIDIREEALGKALLAIEKNLERQLKKELITQRGFKCNACSNSNFNRYRHGSFHCRVSSRGSHRKP